MTLRRAFAFVGVVLAAAPACARDVRAEVDFLTRASRGNLFAIEESRLAVEQAGDPRVKSFARRLVEDHERAEAELAAAADGSGATVPMGLGQGEQARIATSRNKSGAAFDRAYIEDQDTVHSNLLTLYGDYMLLGDNKKLKALAIKMIPITQGQLKSGRTDVGK